MFQSFFFATIVVLVLGSHVGAAARLSMRQQGELYEDTAAASLRDLASAIQLLSDAGADVTFDGVDSSLPSLLKWNRRDAAQSGTLVDGYIMLSCDFDVYDPNWFTPKADGFAEDAITFAFDKVSTDVPAYANAIHLVGKSDPEKLMVGGQQMNSGSNMVQTVSRKDYIFVTDFDCENCRQRGSHTLTSLIEQQHEEQGGSTDLKLDNDLKTRWAHEVTSTLRNSGISEFNELTHCDIDLDVDFPTLLESGRIVAL